MAHSLSAKAAVKQIQQGKITASEYIEGFLKKIENKNQLLNVLTAWDKELIKKTVLHIDKHGANLPLAGVLIAVKDNIDVQNLPTGYGAAEVFKQTPKADASVVHLLKEAGAVILGKAATAEFAYAAPAKTRNPKHLDYTPGGSSSGSAAAVAAKMCPVAIGTQTGGSVIRPAAFCGVYGFKPTYGLVGTKGIKPFSPSFDTIGWFSNQIDDLFLIFNVLTNRQIKKQNSQEEIKVAFCPTPFWHKASVEMQNFVYEIARQLNATEICFPVSLKQITHDHQTIMAVEGARSLKSEYQQNSRYLSPQLKKLIEKGLSVSRDVERQAHNRLKYARQIIDAQFEHFDLVICPSAPSSAPKGLASTGNSIFNRMWTALHVPCLNMPLGNDQRNMPLGLQLIGRRYQDEQVLQQSLKLQAQIA